MKLLVPVTLLMFSAAACAAPAGPKWFQTRREAMAEVKKTGKPLLIDANTQWCGPCQMMKDEVFKSHAFAAEAKRWVLFDMDCDKHPDLANFYGVQGFPSLVVLSPRGKVVASTAGYAGVSATLSFIKKSWAKAKK